MKRLFPSLIGPAHLGIGRDVVGSLAVVRTLVQPPPDNNNIIVIVILWLLLFTWWSRSQWGRGNCSRTWSRIATCTSRTRTPWPHSPQPEMGICSFLTSDMFRQVYLHNNITIRTGAETKVGVEADIFNEWEMNIPAMMRNVMIRNVRMSLH